MPEDSTRWKTIVPVIEELKDRAKQLGLWNLFLSKRHYPEHGTDFTNLEVYILDHYTLSLGSNRVSLVRRYG